MNKRIILRKKDGSTVDGELKVLDITYIDKIMELQHEIYESLENKDFYSCTDRKEFEAILNGRGTAIGCISLEDDELIAIGVYVEYGYEEHNYGYDIEIKGEELLKVAQLESTLVLELYRGNGLQKIMCEMLEDVGRKLGMKYMCATAAPDNKFSCNTFEKLSYKVMADKLKYGGLRRYVFMKRL